MSFATRTQELLLALHSDCTLEEETELTDRLVLLLAAAGLLPIALSYGFAPSTSVPYLFGFPVEGTNQTHIFRAIMGLYLANALFWVIGAMMPSLRVPSLWVLYLFMSGLAAGRILSIVVDGFPNFVLLFYLAAELVFGFLAMRCLRNFT